jgi:protein-disulfide isomerase
MRKRRKRAQRANPRWIIRGLVAAIVVAVGLIAASLTFAKSATTAAATSALDECGGLECGQANAPVTIEVYADFQCPYCARADVTLQQLAPKYIDTGKARLIFRNMPIIGPESVLAAQAGECVADQNKFWTYADYLYTHQANENSGALSSGNLKEIAVRLGLDPGTFNTCLDSGKYSTKVQQEMTEGQQRGVQGTPTFFINGQRYEGALSYDQLVALIDAAQPHSTPTPSH